ncbi:hypothetical protein PIB30_063032 [Stylosanthes scabra]|uniref:Uncharacterized protein n=1 Tax=Stylosanthes scabra TaxID=79078 RepID=A0ABU6SLF2_9FABA|nr:hypothetical protein [Stylosanthes scabra]
MATDGVQLDSDRDDDRGIVLQESNFENEDDFETNYQVDDNYENSPIVHNPVVLCASQYPFGVPSFMWTPDLEAMHALNTIKNFCTTVGFSIRFSFQIRR